MSSSDAATEHEGGGFNGFISSLKRSPNNACIRFKAFRRWMVTPSGIALTLKCLNVIAWGSLLFSLFRTFTATPTDVNGPWWAAKKTDDGPARTISCFIAFGHSWLVIRFRLWKRSDSEGTLRCNLVSTEFVPSVDECTKLNQQDPTIPPPVRKSPPPPSERTLAKDVSREFN